MGIGTDMPNPSSQLEIVAKDRGVLIPQVSLTGTTDQTTIGSGNIESLLVYNIQTISDVRPGYYYWFEDSWKRIVISDEVNNDFTETVTTLENNNDGTYTYVNEDGTSTVIDLNEIDLLISVVDNSDGTYSFKDQPGNTLVTIDTSASASGYDGSTSGLTSTNVQDAIDEVLAEINSGGGVSLIDNVDGTVSLASEDGTPLGTIAKTAVTDNTDGTYTIDNGNGTPVVIDTNAGSLGFDNSTNGFTSTNVQGALEEIKSQLDGTTDILVDNGDGTFTHTAVDGAEVIMDANTTSVTVTDGVYNFTNGVGTTIATIDTNASASGYDGSTRWLFKWSFND